MALIDQNPNNLTYWSKIQWCVDWIRQLRGRTSGGGGGGTLAIGETVEGATPLRMLYTDADGKLQVSDGYQVNGLPTFSNYVINEGGLYINTSNGSYSIDVLGGDPRVGYFTSGGNSFFINLPASATGNHTINYPVDADGTIALQEWVNDQKGIVNGIASLDSGGVVPVDQLPFSVADYLGTWDASTNAPFIEDGEGGNGDFYVVSTGGTQDLGSGNITFSGGNLVIYNGTLGIWQKAGGLASATVTSVSSADNTWLTVANGTTTPVLTVISAPKLSTARTINNVSFDGTANILLNQAVNSQTGTTYTFVVADNQKLVTANNAASQIYTVPTNASQPFPVGAQIDLIQLGTGNVTFSPASVAVTLRSRGGLLTVNGQYTGVTLKKIGTNEWVIMGNLL
jgi:hypothetical protein